MNPDEIEIPPLYTPEQEAQIMKGRKKQGEIDAGRAIIQQRIDDRQKALTLKQQLTDKRDTAAEKAAGETPYEQGRQIAMNAVPLAAGYWGGHKGADYLDERFKNAAGYRAEQLKNLAAAADTMDPRAVARTSDKLGLGQTRRGGLASYLVPGVLGGMGAGVRFVGAEHVPNEVGRDVARAAGTAEMGAGLGMLGQMLLQDVSSTPQINAVDLAKIEQARLAAKGKPPLSPYAAPAAPQAAPPTPAPLTPSPGSTPALAAPEAPPSAAPGSKAHMVEQARALGVKGAGGMNKSELAEAIGKSMGENAGRRVRSKVVEAASKGTKAIFPAAVGYGVYDALRNPAQADDGSVREASSVPAALAAGTGATAATGGAIAGAGKLADALSPMVKPAAGAAMNAMAPSMIDSMTEYTPEEMDQAKHWFARNLPTWMQTQAQKDAYEMSLVPERSPLARALLAGQ